MTTDETTSPDHLRQAQDAFAAASKALDDPEIISEDRPLDENLLAKALEHYQQAATGFAADGQPSLEAQALLGQAEVLIRMPLNVPEARERVVQAEQCARAAVERLDCVQEPVLALRAFLLLGEAMQYAAQARPQEQEVRLRGLCALLDSAAYLAQDQNDGLSLARAQARSCHVLSMRFERDRDENLLDAIDLGDRTIVLMREIPATHGFELPQLLLDLGTCCLKVGGDRARWLAQGRDWYREGAAAVDSRRYPRLHRILSQNATMAEALLAERNHDLPETEMVARYASGIASAAKRNDAANARSLAWGFLAWAWSLKNSPNVHVGEAHKALAKVAMSLGNPDEAQHHLYHSVGVLSAVLSNQDRWFFLLGQARDLFAKVLMENGQAESIAMWLARAEQSFAEAEAACARGARLVEQDRAAASVEFEHALNVFPVHPTARFYRGVIRMTDGDLAAALADFDFYMQLKPKSLRAHMNRATVKAGLGDNDGARADLDAALEIDPTDVDARRVRAQFEEQRGGTKKTEVREGSSSA